MIASLLTALPGAARKAPAKASRSPALALSRVRRYRSIFISDTHLGTRGCKAERLADFLAHNDCDTLYLIGDIIDGWALTRGWYWPASHTDVIFEILRKVESGTRVIYVPGNHDEALRDYAGVSLAGVELKPEFVHRTADGKQFLIIHGDQFDGIIAYAKWLAYLGDRAYALALALNNVFNAARRLIGMRYWSLSAYLKFKVKNAAKFISNFEEALAREARARGMDGVICGHIHHAAIHDDLGITYVNCGDWVESCTAVVEHQDGRLEILHWTAEPPQAEIPEMMSAQAA